MIKRFIGVTLVLMLAGLGPVLATPSLKSVVALKKQGMAVWQSDPAKAEQLFRRAFDEAMYFTRPAMRSGTRETALALASGCLHPSLFVELRLAIETYMSMYPKGRHRAEVLINKALLLFAEGRTLEGVEVLTEAEGIAKGAVKKRITWQKFHALVRARYYRSAEAYLKTIHGENTKGRRGRSVRRFPQADTALRQDMGLTAKPETMTAELKKLEMSLEKTYFTSSAPEAEILLLMSKDQGQELLHGADVDLQELTRVSLHHFPATFRVERLKKFLEEYPEAPAELTGHAMLELRSIHLHELKDPAGAEEWLKKMSLVPGFEDKARMEALLENLAAVRIDSPEAADALRGISHLNHLFPYDNGWMPVYDADQHRELQMAALLLNDRPKEAFDSLKSADIRGQYGAIPTKLLFLMATDQKMLANREYEKVKPELSTRESTLVQDFLFPLWKVVNPTDRHILTAYLISARFPKVAIDHLLTEICGHPRAENLEHAFALLAELYQEYRNYMEAQKIWVTLRDLFPGSPWTK